MENSFWGIKINSLAALFFDAVRYATTGVFVFATVYAVNNLLFLCGLSAWAATLSGSAVAAVVGYFLHARFSFRVAQHTWAMPVKFAIRQLVCIGIAQLLIYVCYNVLAIYYPLASFIASAGSTVAAFLLARFWVFPERNREYKDSTA